MKKPDSIDAYLKTVSPDRRAALQKLRRAIHAVMPGAEECISYSMPAFRIDGQTFAGFLATTKGCSYYPFSGTTLDTVGMDIADYEQTKSALHFDPERGIPTSLLRKLIKARLAETAHKAPKKKASSAAGASRRSPRGTSPRAR